MGNKQRRLRKQQKAEMQGEQPTLRPSSSAVKHGYDNLAQQKKDNRLTEVKVVVSGNASKEDFKISQNSQNNSQIKGRMGADSHEGREMKQVNQEQPENSKRRELTPPKQHDEDTFGGVIQAPASRQQQPTLLINPQSHSN